MRFFCFALLFSIGVFGQIGPQPQQAKVPDDSVVATIDGKKYTAGQVREMAAGLPPQAQQMMTIDPAGVLQQIFIMKYLASEAEKQGLDKESPIKDHLELQRAN